MARVSARRQARVEGVARLKERLRETKQLILTDYRGLTVAQITELRRTLREHSAEYRVVKNSLTQRAAYELGIEDLAGYLQGPTAVAFASGDLVATAKVLTAFARKAPILQVKAALVDGRVLPREEILAVAELPPREVLVARLVGLMVAPLRGLTAVLSGSLRGVVVGLDQVRQKKEASGG
ncbi:MAG: 50S ribosomal protein L10 [Candidatus Methylomirabilales bacterium]